MSSFKGRILVIRGGAIGDFILTLPAIAALRGQFPQAYIEVLGYPHIAQLALAGRLVNQVQSIEARALAGFFARGGQLAETLVDYFSDFDVIVSYLYDPDEIFRTNVARCTSAQFIAGPHRASDRESMHASKVYLKPLEQLAIFDADPVPRLHVDPGLPNANQLALHPGSGSEKKNWPEDKWVDLLQQLLNTTRHNFLLIGGEAEGERLKRLAAELPSERTRLAQSLALSELAALLQCSSAFVGHDSGISHLAAAVGLPGIVLWADTVEEVWRPPGEKILILRHPEGLPNLSVKAVLEHVTKLFNPI